ncbi:MAG: translation initiation factor IF-2 subunit gamma [Candidatus Micrarchaeota archaeon]|nr:translation initiation factor IF-2 subunit gamma [Candidatus Micrarchaeota archaeon]
MQAQINIGLFGHVDHGKTSLTKALSGKWTDTHSEEIKRGITIRLGYSQVSFYKNKKTGQYLPEHLIAVDQKQDFEFCREISFLDAPGHETLMATMIASVALVDAALLIIAANEPCPQAQTAEHLAVLDLMGIKNIIIVQNKIDLVTEQEALKHYEQIKNFVKGTVAENAPIIPVSANYNTNIDELVKCIEQNFPTPQKKVDLPAKMYVVRSFDVNKPGTKIEDLQGGVFGGSIVQGKIKVGDVLSLRPGLLKKQKDKTVFVPVDLKVVSISTEKGKLQEAVAGGLIGIGTLLDPALAKGDMLVGQVFGQQEALGQLVLEAVIEYELVKRQNFQNLGFKLDEIIVLSVGSATTLGVIKKIKEKTIYLTLKRGIYASLADKIAISKKVEKSWRFVAVGKFLSIKG